MPAEQCPDGAPRRPAAVLWDMDGTLVDSEPVWAVALDDLARELGGTFGAAALDALVGADLATTVDVLLAEVGLPATPERVADTRERLVARTGALLAEGVPWRPGARAAVAAVRAAGIPSALVTNTVRRLAELTLAGLGESFDVVVCGDDVPAGKPAPDPYLRSAALLGVPVEECVAVEDSPDGARSAERAGAAVLVVPSEVPVPGGPRRTHRDGLVGLTVTELAAALSGAPGRAVGRPVGRLVDAAYGRCTPSGAPCAPAASGSAPRPWVDVHDDGHCERQAPLSKERGGTWG